MLLVALALTLAGCGYYRWHKDGQSREAFQADSSECEKQAASGKWQECMLGKGWTYGARM
jgi:hypothetical protein